MSTSGLFLHDPITYEKYESILESIDVKLELYINLVDVKSVLVYKNTSDKLVEADFQFPLEQSASVYFMEMKTKDVTLVAECKGKSEAIETYDKAKKEGHTVSLAMEDESAPDVFKVKLGNIPPKESIKITLMFTFMGEIKFNRPGNGKISKEIYFSLPQVLNPRYSTDSSFKKIFGGEKDMIIINNKYKFSFESKLTMDQEIVNVSSPNLAYNIEYLDGINKKVANVKLSDPYDYKHDIELHVILAEENSDDSNFSMFFEEGQTSDDNEFLSKHCISASFRPPMMDSIIENKNEFIFVIDRSGSMGGANIESAKKSLLLFLKSLPKQSRMQIIGFGTDYAAHFDGPVDITEETMKKAMEYQKSMEANMGGTEMYNALKAAFDSPLSGVGWQKQIILITDGDIWNIEDVKTLCAENETVGRVFAVGLGEGASTALVNGLAEASNGKARFARNPLQLTSVVMDIFNFAVQGRASDVSVEWKLEKDQSGKVYQIPSKLVSVYSDTLLTCYGLYDGAFNNLNGTATLTYYVKGNKFEISEKFGPDNILKIDNKALPIHRIAAKVQLKELSIKYGLLKKTSDKEDDINLKNLQDQMKLLSIESNVISKVTAYICVDPKKQEKTDSVNLVLSRHMSEKEDDLKLDALHAPRNRMMKTKPLVPPSSASFFSEFSKESESISADYFKTKSSLNKMTNYGMNIFRSFKMPAILRGGFDSSNQIGDDGIENESIDNLMSLIELQDFNGNWTEKDKIYDLIHQIDEKLVKDKISSGSKNYGKNVWITKLVISILDKYYKNRLNEWKYIKAKAETWLNEQNPDMSKLQHEIDICLN